MPTVMTPTLPLVGRLPNVADSPRPPSASASAAAPLQAAPPSRQGQSPLDAILRQSLEAAGAHAVRQSLLNRLAELWGAQKVAFGWRWHGQGPWLCAVSGQGLVDPRSDIGRAYVAALAETTLSNEKRRWCGSDEPPPAVPLSYRQLAGATGALAISGIPLGIGTERPAAAVLILDASGPELLGRDEEVLAISAALAGLGRLCDEAAPNALTRISRWWTEMVAPRRRLSVLAGAATLGLMGLLPVADRVLCPATLEPSVRRYVAAPFDGKLEKAVAQVGDTVAAGQALALFDRRPLEMELATLSADLDEAAKRRDSARAKGQAAQAQLADLELAQIQSKIDQLERQLDELTVTSPIHGVIVRGQLDRVEGAPLARGQNLFEVAPLSPLVAELAIPEDEVSLVKRGQVVVVRPLATGQSLEGAIERIHPRAEVISGQTVFIAEVALDNAQGQMRPGMQAKAVVYGNRRPLAFALLRRPLARFARWTWW